MNELVNNTNNDYIDYAGKKMSKIDAQKKRNEDIDYGFTSGIFFIQGIDKMKYNQIISHAIISRNNEDIWFLTKARQE